MMKRKEIDDDKVDAGVLDESSSAESSSDDDTDMLNVDFEWFDPQLEHDFPGLKTLLRQLFDVDSQSFDLSALTDLILAQPLLGSTVKVDGNETDPYAFLTILNLWEHKDKPIVLSLLMYIVQQATANSCLLPIKEHLRIESTSRIGLVLTERLINIPSEVVPPMYRMLEEEISWAIEAKEPYDFSHYLILSKTYTEVASKLEEDSSRPQKKKKKKQKIGSGPGEDSAVFYFHPEDEVLQRYATVHGGFDYLKQEDEGHSDSKRAFQDLGVKPRGHFILIEAAKFGAAVKALEEYFN